MKAYIFEREILQGGCLVFETRTNAFKSQWHSHSEYELVFIKKGAGILQYGATTTHYKAGDLFLLGPWIPHEFTEESRDHHSVSCIFHADLLSLSSYQCLMSQNVKQLLQRALNGIKFPINLDTSDYYLHFFSQILKEEGLKQAIELLFFINSLIDLKTPNEPISDIEDPSGTHFFKKYAQLQNILKYINDNITQNITIQEIAEKFFISRSTLVRLFSDILQTGITQYITQKRLFHACQLLSTTNLPITKISGRIGFTSISSFNRSFLKYRGMSPRAYRQSTQAKLAGNSPLDK